MSSSAEASGSANSVESSQLGPSYDGTVMLDIGGDRGALIIMTPPELHLAEIELSLVGDERAQQPVEPHEHGDGHVHAHAHPHRTHVAVRERRGPTGIRYAAIYPSLAEGEYTVWDLDGTPKDTVRVAGGEVTQLDWA